jgi:15-cis-phytoene synthase
MTPDQYCHDRLANTGSSAHYCLLFLPRDRRRPLAALFALQRELDEAVDRSSDPAVAHARLAWWAQEIERLFKSDPQHPVTRALAPHLGAAGLSYAMLEPALVARHATLQMASFEDFDSLRSHAAAASGVFGQLAARLAGAQGEQIEGRGSRIASAVRLVRLLRDAGLHARRGRLVVPETDCRAFGIPTDHFAGAEYGDRYEALMRLQAERAREELADAAQGLAAGDRRALQPCLILGRLYEALLAELEHARFRVLDQRIAMTPMRKLLLACRMRAFGPPRTSVLS